MEPLVYQISELAKQVGLSRTALLYYEKLGLIKGNRLPNGYRAYSKMDLQRIKFVTLLRQGGLTLKECKICLESKVDHQMIKHRLGGYNKPHSILP